MGLDHLRKELLDLWQDVPAAEICMKILDFVENTPQDQLRFLTFATLSRAAGRQGVDSDLLAAVNILAGSKLALFDVHALFIDDDETEHEVSPEEIAEARATGKFIHPETGERVSDYERHIIPFFSPNKRLIAEMG